jgi:peptidoglycan hydrolase-like protein with peptidoglycan-binding domain
MGSGAGTPGADVLTDGTGASGDSVDGSDGGNGTSYGAAAGIAGGAGALGLGGAALAARSGGGTVTGGQDSEIDRIAAAHGYGSRGTDVTTMQQRLTDAGYDTQGVDGKWGPNTQAAYDAYRADHPLPVQQGSGYTAPSGFDYNQIKGVRNNPNVTPEFLRQMEGVAQRVGAKPEELMGVMSLETMGTFRPSVANPDTHATGLIQFMPRTAQGLGTSIGDLSRMTPSEQLPWVEKYLSQPQYRGRVGSLEGLYSAVLPGRIMDGDDVMFRPGTAAYNANRWLDTDGRNGISVQEAVQQVRIRMGQGAGAH